MRSWLRRRDDRDWRDVELLALDFETTTGEPREAEPLSVGWVVVAQGRVRLRDAGYQLIDHNGDVPLESLGIHRLIPDDLAKGVPIDEVAQRLRRAVRDRVVVAHGGWIERALLKRMQVPHQALADTLAIVRRLDERSGAGALETSLSAVARRFGVPPLRAHHAFGDALTTAFVLLAIAGRMERERSQCLVDDLVRLGRMR